MPKFFIVTPSYNQAQFLSETLRSVQRQGAKHLTYWVMDGGSTDASPTILKKWQKRWSILQFVSKKDHGQTDAINQGIKNLRKRASLLRSPSTRRTSSTKKQSLEIFAYLNSDDYYLPGAFQKVAAAFAAHPHKAWVVGDAVIVDENGKPIQSAIQLYKKLFRALQLPWLLQIMNPYPQPAVFIRWSAVQKIGDFNDQLRYTMDYDYWQRLLRRFGTPVLLNEPLAAFRIHSRSKGGSQYPAQFAEQFQVAQHYTHNRLLLSMQQIHNWLILGVYRLVK